MIGSLFDPLFGRNTLPRGLDEVIADRLLDEPRLVLITSSPRRAAIAANLIHRLEGTIIGFGTPHSVGGRTAAGGRVLAPLGGDGEPWDPIWEMQRRIVHFMDEEHLPSELDDPDVLASAPRLLAAAESLRGKTDPEALERAVDLITAAALLHLYPGTPQAKTRLRTRASRLGGVLKAITGLDGDTIEAAAFELGSAGLGRCGEFFLRIGADDVAPKSATMLVAQRLLAGLPTEASSAMPPRPFRTGADRVRIRVALDPRDPGAPGLAAAIFAEAMSACPRPGPAAVIDVRGCPLVAEALIRALAERDGIPGTLILVTNRLRRKGLAKLVADRGLAYGKLD